MNILSNFLYFEAFCFLRPLVRVQAFSELGLILGRCGLQVVKVGLLKGVVSILFFIEPTFP